MPLMAMALMVFSGCGTNLNEGLFQAASASGRSLLDIFLTDLQNSVADALDSANTPSGEDQNGGEMTPPENTSGDQTPIDELTGDPALGEEIFMANNCSACHCDDAMGGCALNAPNLVEVSVDIVDDHVRGDAEHPGGKFNFSNQDVVDLQSYLASLGGS